MVAPVVMDTDAPVAVSRPALSGKLDFLISGVPRSGTTALVQALDLHPSLFCGSEMFRPAYDYTQLHMPDDLLNDTDPDQLPWFHWSVRMLREKLASGTPSLLLGNKTPRQYVCFTSLLAHNPAVKWIHLVRDPVGFALSWDQRAMAQKFWKPGQIGVFGILEFAFSLERLANLDRQVMLVDYDALYYRDPTLIRRVLEHVGVEGSGAFDAGFREKFFTAKPRKEADSPFYRELLKRHPFGPVMERLAERPILFNDDPVFRQRVADLHLIERIKPREVLDELDAHGNKDALEYCVWWCRWLQRLIDDQSGPASAAFLEKLDKLRRLSRHAFEERTGISTRPAGNKS